MRKKKKEIMLRLEIKICQTQADKEQRNIKMIITINESS